jgi:hypothetical protein
LGFVRALNAESTLGALETSVDCDVGGNVGVSTTKAEVTSWAWLAAS